MRPGRIYLRPNRIVQLVDQCSSVSDRKLTLNSVAKQACKNLKDYAVSNVLQQFNLGEFAVLAANVVNAHGKNKPRDTPENLQVAKAYENIVLQFGWTVHHGDGNCTDDMNEWKKYSEENCSEYFSAFEEAPQCKQEHLTVDLA